MKVALAILYCFAVGTIYGQTGSENPFELSHRLDSVYIAPASTGTNVFDIKRDQEVTEPIKLDSPQKTAYPVIPVESEEILGQPEKENNSEPATAQPEAEVTSSNPFEVSHIPLRKSKLKEGANAFVKQKTKQDNSTSNIFIFWLVLLSCVIIAFVINTKSSVIPSMVKSFTNTNVLLYNKREENGGISGHYLLLYIIFFINAGIFIYLLLNKYTNYSSGVIYVYCLLGVILLYLLRHFLLYALGYIFPISKEVNIYNFSIQVNNNLLGLVLIPLNLIVAFGPTSLSIAFIYISLITVVFFYVIRSVRGLLLAAPYIQKHIFHFFLYLCAFEIIPILLCMKLIT